MSRRNSNRKRFLFVSFAVFFFTNSVSAEVRGRDIAMPVAGFISVSVIASLIYRAIRSLENSADKKYIPISTTAAPLPTKKAIQ